jgi:energy-coupling factor transporter transmembrane protein EcfT
MSGFYFNSLSKVLFSSFRAFFNFNSFEFFHTSPREWKSYCLLVLVFLYFSGFGWKVHSSVILFTYSHTAFKYLVPRAFLISSRVEVLLFLTKLLSKWFTYVCSIVAFQFCSRAASIGDTDLEDYCSRRVPLKCFSKTKSFAGKSRSISIRDLGILNLVIEWLNFERVAFCVFRR